VGCNTDLQTPEKPTNSTLVAISAAAAGLVFILVTAGTVLCCPLLVSLTEAHHIALHLVFLTGLWYIGRQSNTQGFGQIRLPAEEAAKLMADHVPASLRFSDISYTLGDRVILDNITGHLKPGQATAIMGASGAGKSTFLDILARKQKRGTVSGTMKVNGRFVKSEEFRRIMGFVDQEDTLMSTLTVYETVLYSALLRLPREMSLEAKKYRTLETLNELGILPIKDMRIGESGAHELEMTDTLRDALNMALSML
jgi:ABC-type multidrug transport system fused ATPase/permease subunit